VDSWDKQGLSSTLGSDDEYSPVAFIFVGILGWVDAANQLNFWHSQVSFFH
jgi:hypothetical protein